MTRLCTQKSRETSQKKAFYNNNIEKVEILHIHDKVALLMRKHSDPGTRNCHQKRFGKVWIIYVEHVDQKMKFLYGSDGN